MDPHLVPSTVNVLHNKSVLLINRVVVKVIKKFLVK